MEKEQVSPKTEGELDLMDLMSEIWKQIVVFGTWFYKKLKQFVRFNFRYWWLCIVFALLAVAAFGYKKFVKPNVTAQYVLNLKGVAYPEIVSRVGALNLEVNPLFGSEGLVKTLKLRPEEASHVRGFQSLYCLDINEDGVMDEVGEALQLPNDSIVKAMKYQLAVNVRLSGMTNMKRLGDAVVDYLNADTILQEMMNHYVDVHLEEIAFNQREVERLDSLRKGRINSISQGTMQGNGVNMVFENNVYTNEMLRLEGNIVYITLNLGKQEKPVRAMSTLRIVSGDSTFQVFTHYALPIYLIGLLLALCVSDRKRFFRFLKAKK